MLVLLAPALAPAIAPVGAGACNAARCRRAAGRRGLSLADRECTAVPRCPCATRLHGRGAVAICAARPAGGRAGVRSGHATRGRGSGAWQRGGHGGTARRRHHRRDRRCPRSRRPRQRLRTGRKDRGVDRCRTRLRTDAVHDPARRCHACRYADRRPWLPLARATGADRRPERQCRWSLCPDYRRDDECRRRRRRACGHRRTRTGAQRPASPGSTRQRSCLARVVRRPWRKTG